MSDYDIITIGGGMGGAALAKSMAEEGERVLVLERETKFKDRVRGEGMAPWGCAEARELGIYDLLTSKCAHELPIWEDYVGPMQVSQRHLPSTTPQGLPSLAFSHQKMQQTLLDAAASAGAEVRTGVRATRVTPGKIPSVIVEHDGGAPEEIKARIVVGVDGRGSLVRKWGAFTEHQDAPRLLLGGVLFENSSIPQDTVRFVNDFATGHATIAFPQGDGRVRTYFANRASESVRLQGDKDVPRFIEECVGTGMPREYFVGARPAGPLATFDGAECYIGHPYKAGIALVGDAAASSDPSWGQGMALTLRDARVLRDALLANDDWDAAGHAYAVEHDRYFGVVHTVADWFTKFFFEVGPDADARRERAFPLFEEDPERMPDTFATGPDHPVDDAMRNRFFGED